LKADRLGVGWQNINYNGERIYHMQNQGYYATEWTEAPARDGSAPRRKPKRRGGAEQFDKAEAANIRRSKSQDST
jgi:hypothetical protein